MTIGEQLGATVEAIQAKGNELIQLVHGQTSSAVLPPNTRLTHDTASVDLLDDERFDGIENGDLLTACGQGDSETTIEEGDLQ